MGWLLLIVVLLIASVAAFIFWQRKNTPAKKTHSTKHLTTAAKVHGKYHCVTVHGDAHVCEGIKQLQGKSLLPHEAPSLPLAACPMQPCKCHYIHHEDRRLRNRREPFGELNSTSIASNDRPLRARVDRRKAVKPE